MTFSCISFSLKLDTLNRPDTASQLSLSSVIFCKRIGHHQYGMYFRLDLTYMYSLWDSDYVVLEKYLVYDIMTFSVHHIRRHRRAICPITDDALIFWLRCCLPGFSTLKLSFFALWLISNLQRDTLKQYKYLAPLQTFIWLFYNTLMILAWINYDSFKMMIFKILLFLLHLLFGILL